ncbi:hypothetical protein J6590_015008 [Homalodisca vitripennis]|nr:hypothetical protein J6590_015008 [Homalodisca vitripennis]
MKRYTKAVQKDYEIRPTYWPVLGADFGYHASSPSSLLPPHGAVQTAAPRGTWPIRAGAGLRSPQGQLSFYPRCFQCPPFLLGISGHCEEDIATCRGFFGQIVLLSCYIYPRRPNGKSIPYLMFQRVRQQQPESPRLGKTWQACVNVSAVRTDCCRQDAAGSRAAPGLGTPGSEPRLLGGTVTVLWHLPQPLVALLYWRAGAGDSAFCPSCRTSLKGAAYPALEEASFKEVRWNSDVVLWTTVLRQGRPILLPNRLNRQAPIPEPGLNEIN